MPNGTSTLGRLVCLIWWFVLSNVIAVTVATGSVAFNYDGQNQVRMVYDGSFVAAFNYDSAGVRTKGEEANPTAGAGGLFGKIAQLLAAENVVYREISAADRAALEAGQPLVPRANGGSILDHVRGQPTGHISASQTIEGTARFSGGNGLVAIDVDAATADGTRFIPHPEVLEGVGRGLSRSTGGR